MLPVLLFFFGVVGFLSSSNNGRLIDHEASPTTLGALMPLANLGSNRMQSSSPQFRGVAMPAREMQNKMNQAGIGSGPLQELAISAIESSNRCNGVRDVSANANPSDVFSRMDAQTKSMVVRASEQVALKAEDMAGVIEPTGFFDPLGFSTRLSEGSLRFYREVELKHGRVCMLASLGIIVGENYHPLFGGNIDVPAAFAFQQTPLETFWPAVVFAIAIPELFSVFTFEDPKGYFEGNGPLWSIRSDHVPGDLGYDPLGLKPSDPAELKIMQTKELNNGRLAMIATAGMIAQELATGKGVF